MSGGLMMKEMNLLKHHGKPFRAQKQSHTQVSDIKYTRKNNEISCYACKNQEIIYIMLKT